VPVPGISAKKLALIEPDLNTGGTESFSNTLRCRRIL